MNCFSCFSAHEKKASKVQDNRSSRGQIPAARPQRESPREPRVHPQPLSHTHLRPPRHEDGGNQKAFNKEAGNIAAQTFTFRELATATKNFRQECLIGEGGFGRVYKGRLEKPEQIVAVKQLDRNGLQGNREFLVEVLMLSLLHHQNLVNLIGYCADGDQRLLVYEFMSRGSLEDHLLDIPPNQPPLDWFKRMKIALHAAKGLEYLHIKANPPVIYRDLKSSNILLDDEFNAKLSDFGLAKLGPVGDKTHVSSRVMGTYGYCAPEYQLTGQLTVKSDVYSFGVVLLELITGRRAIDTLRSPQEQNLSVWAEPMFKDPNRHSELADPLLHGNYPKKSLSQAIAVSAMCVNEDPAVRPLMSDVVTALSYLWKVTDTELASPRTIPEVPVIGSNPAHPASFPEETTTEEEEEDDDYHHHHHNNNNNNNNLAEERQKAIAEAMEWGSYSRDQVKSSVAS